MTMKMSPKYTHDCDKCVFLGTFNGEGFKEEEQDLYFCSEIYPTVITRYGNDGPEYTSGLHFAHLIPGLAEAKRRAQELNLLQENILVILFGFVCFFLLGGMTGSVLTMFSLMVQELKEDYD